MDIIELQRALLNWRVQLFGLASCFLVAPILMQSLLAGLGLVFSLADFLGAGMVYGLRVLSCMPPPVSCAVIMTKVN